MKTAVVVERAPIRCLWRSAHALIRLDDARIAPPLDRTPERARARMGSSGGAMVVMDSPGRPSPPARVIGPRRSSRPQRHHITWSPFLYGSPASTSTAPPDSRDLGDLPARRAPHPQRGLAACSIRTQSVSCSPDSAPSPRAEPDPA